jgi:hypothetical protein
MNERMNREEMPSETEGRTTEVGCDVIAFCATDPTAVPLAGQAEVVCALAADMIVAEMGVEHLWVGERAVAVLPLADVGRR